MRGAWWSTGSSSTQTSPTTRTTWVNAPCIKFLQKNILDTLFIIVQHCAKKDCNKLKLTSSPVETASTCSSQARPPLPPSSIHRWLAGAKVCLGLIKEDNLISGEPNFWFSSKNFYTFPTDVSPLVGVRLFTMEHSSQGFTRFRFHRIVLNPKAFTFWSCVF